MAFTALSSLRPFLFALASARPVDIVHSPVAEKGSPSHIADDRKQMETLGARLEIGTDEE